MNSVPLVAAVAASLAGPSEGDGSFDLLASDRFRARHSTDSLERPWK